MTSLQSKVSFYYSILVAICLIPSIVLAVGPEDADEWAVGSAISASITSPATNTYLPINHTKSLTATASDVDCYRVEETWYSYSDDVTSGNAPSDYHIFWTASVGGFYDECGTSASYYAPDYSAGNNVRNATITATAYDFNRSPDTYGYADGSDSDQITLKVWQVTVTKKQTGSRSTNNDCSGTLPTLLGGNTLGWVSHGTPTGCTGYYGKTELKGTIPSDVPTVSGFAWIQDTKGVIRFKTLASIPNWVTPYFQDTSTWADDSPFAIWQDGDSRHPNTTGTDVNEIFMLDAPGFDAWASNNANIAAPVNGRALNYDLDFRSYVKLGGVRVSNQMEWDVAFTVVENSGVWALSGGHTP